MRARPPAAVPVPARAVRAPVRCAVASLLLVAAAGCAPERDDAPAPAPTSGDAALATPARERVLVFAGGDGTVHGATRAVADEVAAVASEAGLRAEVATDADALAGDALADARLLALVHTSGASWDAALRTDVRRFVQAGGGVVLVHPTLAYRNDWGWMRRLAGTTRAMHGPERVRDVGTRAVDSGWHAVGPLLAGSAVEVVDRAGAPLAWRRTVEGARVFATDFGHDAASLALAPARDALRNGIVWAAGDGAPLDFARAMPRAGSLAKEVLAGNAREPIALALLPGGGAIVTQRRGDLASWMPGESELRAAGHVDVDAAYEYGLLGIALDRSFPETGWLYVLATKPRDGASPRRHRVARFDWDAQARAIDPASERVLLEIPLDEAGAIHAGGALAMDGDGLLWIATGDDTQPSGSDGYAPLDFSPGRERFDAARTAGSAGDLRGKLLRIRPERDGTYSIPDGNLFAAGARANAGAGADAGGDAPGGRPEIFAMGLRNPFTLALDAAGRAVFVGEPGPDASRDDAVRGPRGYDEIERVDAPGNFGWPFFGGDGSAYGPAKQPAEAPRNASPHAAGSRALPPARAAWLAYPYAWSADYPELGRGGRSVFVGGVVDDAVRGGRRLLVGDFMRESLHWVAIDEGGAAARIEPVAPGVAWSSPVGAAIGADGAIYVLEYGTGWYSENTDAQLARLVPRPDAGAPDDARAAPDARASRAGGDALERWIALAGSASFHRDGALAWRFAGEAGDAARARVRVRYVEERGDARAAEALEAHGCASCHVALAAGEAGPGAPPGVDALRARYAAPTDAVLEALADKVERGGAGSFGEVPMPPQTGIDRATLRRMLAHWLAPRAAPAVHEAAASGSLALREHAAHVVDTRVGPLVRGGYRVSVEVDGTERASRLVRALRFPADEHDAAAGVQLAPAGGGVDAVVAVEEGAWLRFDAVDLRGVASIDVLVAGVASASGARVELRVGAPDGAPLGAPRDVDLRRARTARVAFPVDAAALPGSPSAGRAPGDLYVVVRRGRARELAGILGIEVVPRARAR